MKKILTSLIVSLLCSVSLLKAEDRVIIVKPMLTTDFDTETHWGGANAIDEEKYILEKVEGEDNLYMCSITLDKYFKTNKWKPAYGEQYDPEDPNEGWSDQYYYHVVYQDSYWEGTTGSVASNNHPKSFKVESDGTTVTFYARLVQDGDYNTGNYNGKIRSFCDAQTPQLYIWGPNVWEFMPAGIGEEMSDKEINIEELGVKIEISLYSKDIATGAREWADVISEQGVEKNAIYTRGRHIVNIDYKSLMFFVYKVLDETDNPKIKVGEEEYRDAEDFTGNIGIFQTESPLLLTASIDGKTVTDNNTKINTETVMAYFYYEIIPDGQTEGIINCVEMTTAAGETNHATWISEAINITDELANGDYAMKVWYEMSVGVDTLINDNEGEGYVMTFSVDNGADAVKLEMYVDGGFETICLPFNVMKILDSEGNAVAPARLLEYTDNIGEIVYFSEATDIQANTPYLIALPEEEAAEKKEITFIGTIKEITDPVVTKGDYSFVGTYVTYEEETDPDYYVLNITGDSFVKAIETTYVPANRAYFKAISSASHSTLRIDTDGTTKIELMEDRIDELMIYPVENGIKVISDKVSLINIYGIDGSLVRSVKVQQGENMIRGIVKGLYLVNNQKVVVK